MGMFGFVGMSAPLSRFNRSNLLRPCVITNNVDFITNILKTHREHSFFNKHNTNRVVFMNQFVQKYTKSIFFTLGLFFCSNKPTETFASPSPSYIQATFNNAETPVKVAKYRVSVQPVDKTDDATRVVHPWIIDISLEKSNHSSKVAILKTFTPFESSVPIHARIFNVFDITDQSPVKYIGPQIKRTASTYKDAVVLNESNGILSQSVDLSGGFQFKAGHSYRVEMEFPLQVYELSSTVDQQDLSRMDMNQFILESDIEYPSPFTFTADIDSNPPWITENQSFNSPHRVSRPIPASKSQD